jgi:serine/threonine protein kinase
MVIGREDVSLVHLIDFGLSKTYRRKDGQHIKYSNKGGLIGTARYASINALQNME